MMEFVGNVFTVIFLWGLFNFTMYIFRIRKIMKQYKDNPNVRGVQIINGEVKVIEKEPTIVEAEFKEEVKDMVYDAVCGKEIEKANAYHLVRDGQDYYFCSWDCREKFLQSQ